VLSEGSRAITFLTAIYLIFEGMEKNAECQTMGRRLDAKKFVAGRVFAMLWHVFAGIKRVCAVVLGEWSLSGNVMDIVGVFQSVPTTTKVSQRRVSVLRTEARCVIYMAAFIGYWHKEVTDS